MDFLVAILVLAAAAAVVFAIMQRRPAGARRLHRPRADPIGRRPRGAVRRDPMAAAVADHARATDPAEVVAAERRLRAQARQVASGMQASPGVNGYTPVGYAGDPAVAPVPAAGPGSYAYPAGEVPPTDPGLDKHFDPVTGERIDGYDAADDPRYNDPKYDGRLAADWVDPRYDDRAR
jgi:hypothetical protein